MADPQIQAILSDPVVQQVLQDMQSVSTCTLSPIASQYASVFAHQQLQLAVLNDRLVILHASSASTSRAPANAACDHAAADVSPLHMRNNSDAQPNERTPLTYSITISYNPLAAVIPQLY
eukprot:14309-Heterococcus_DN1.PRE.1